MTSPTISRICFLLISYSIYRIFLFSLHLGVFLIIMAVYFFKRLWSNNPQVPFATKIIDIRLRIVYFLMGVYSGNFSLIRYQLVQKINKLFGNIPPVLPDPPNTHIEKIDVPSLIDDYKIPMKISIKNDVLNSESKLPILFYLFAGDFQMELPFPKKGIFLDLGMIIITISYRLAPTYKFPVALEDSYSCLSYIAKKSHPILKYWDSRLFIYGSSAGGNLAATSCLLNRDRGLNLNIVSQILEFPAMFNRDVNKSHILYGDWYIHGEANVKYIDLSLLRDEKDYENPYLCPLKAKDFKNLPPAYFILAERDYFCSDGELYYQKLKENGNDAICKIYPAEHGFTKTVFPLATKARIELIEYLKHTMIKK